MVKYGYSLVQIWYDLTYYLFPEEQIAKIQRNQDVFDHENWFQNYHRLYKVNFRHFSVGIPVFSIHQHHYDQTHFEMNLAAEIFFMNFEIIANFRVREKKKENLWNDEIKHVTRWNGFFVFWVNLCFGFWISTWRENLFDFDLSRVIKNELDSGSHIEWDFVHR